MGRYIECGEEVIYKYALDQKSNMYLIHEMLGIGRLKHYTADESYGNGCDVLLLIKKDIKKLKEYYETRNNEFEIRGKLKFVEISRGEVNFLRMISHILHYAEKNPQKKVYAFDSEL
jgi:hypothetical protein